VCGHFGLDDELDGHFTQLEPVERCQNETITASTQFISELVPSHELGVEVVSPRETTRICGSFRGYMIPGV
jgi:hypothetical protein